MTRIVPRKCSQCRYGLKVAADREYRGRVNYPDGLVLCKQRDGKGCDGTGVEYVADDAA